MAIPDLNLDNLTTEERLELLERIWESLCRTPDAVPLTTAQREELDRRLDDLERDGPVGVSREEVMRKIHTKSS